MLRVAVKILRDGGVVAYPTDTAYGLAADPENKKAILKIFKIKGRSKEKSLPLIAGSLKIAKKYAVFDILSLHLAKKYWPGPLTLVLKPTALARKNFSKKVFNNGTIAIRVPGSNAARKLSLAIKRPIISTSANVSGEQMCYSASQIKKQFKDRNLHPDFILDGGRLKKVKASTIVEVKDGKIAVLRQGRIKV